MMNKVKYYALRVLFVAALIPVVLIHLFVMLPIYYVVEVLLVIREFATDRVAVPLGVLITKINRCQCKLKDLAKVGGNEKHEGK